MKLIALKTPPGFRIDGPPVGVVAGSACVSDRQRDTKIAAWRGQAGSDETQTLNQAAESVAFGPESAPIDVISNGRDYGKVP